MKKILLITVIALMVVSFLAGAEQISLAQDDNMGYSEEVSGKLDAISKKQDEILKEIASMKEELRVIKVRVTQIQ